VLVQMQAQMLRQMMMMMMVLMMVLRLVTLSQRVALPTLPVRQWPLLLVLTPPAAWHLSVRAEPEPVTAAAAAAP
jgi:hypothetical protein